MIKVEIDSVSMRGNTPVLVMELALAMKSLRESLAKRYGEVATEELISRAMEAGDINEIMSDLIDDVLFKILPKANINKDNIREMPQALKEVLRKMLEDMIMH
ncbi:MAG: hypothetical protein ACLUYU_06185 [Coprococcus sp.]